MIHLPNLFKAQSTWIGKQPKSSWVKLSDSMCLYIFLLFNKILITLFRWYKNVAQKGRNAPQQTSKNPYLISANFCRRNLESFFIVRSTRETPQRVWGQQRAVVLLLLQAGFPAAPLSHPPTFSKLNRERRAHFEFPFFPLLLQRRGGGNANAKKQHCLF